MNENEVILNTEVTTEPEVQEETTGMSTGMAMLIGSGLTIATIALVKKGKKAAGKFLAKRKAAKSKKAEVIEGEVTEVSEEAESDEK